MYYSRRNRSSAMPTFVVPLAVVVAGLAAITAEAAVGAILDHAEPSIDSQTVSRAERIIEAAGVEGGLVVHVGCDDGRLTAALRAGESYLVHGLDTSAENVERSRKFLRSLGLYGDVSVDRFEGNRLPYVDNFANLIVLSDGDLQVASEEVQRVLAPGGVAVDSRVSPPAISRKPWPAEMDEWTHYMHDPAGTCVGKDMLVGPPRRLKWVGGPQHARSHEHTASMHAMVSAKGRVFYVMDEGSAGLRSSCRRNTS